MEQRSSSGGTNFEQDRRHVAAGRSARVEICSGLWLFRRYAQARYSLDKEAHAGWQKGGHTYGK